MKRIITAMLLVLLTLSLFSCKSKEVVAVEEKIAALTDSSSLSDVKACYEAYRALVYEDREKITDLAPLRNYLDPDNGHLVITDKMIEEIKADNEPSEYLGYYGTGVSTAINSQITVDKALDKTDYSYALVTDISSQRLSGLYAYEINGKAKAEDKYGNTEYVNYTVTYYAVIDGSGYKLESEAELS